MGYGVVICGWKGSSVVGVAASGYCEYVGAGAQHDADTVETREGHTFDDEETISDPLLTIAEIEEDAGRHL